MGKLLTLFKHPYHLIEKRKDKKLDFDSFSRQVKRTTDPDKKRQVQKELELAEKNFHGGGGLFDWRCLSPPTLLAVLHSPPGRQPLLPRWGI